MTETSAVLSVAVKAAGGAIAAGATGAIRRPWARWRTSTVVSDLARQRGCEFAPRLIRRWLQRPDVVDLLRTGNATSRRSALDSLRVLLPGGKEEDVAVAEQILEEIFASLAQRLTASESSAVSASRVISAAGAHREEIIEVVRESAINVVKDLGHSQVFERDLAGFQALRRDMLRRVHEEWPPFAHLVRQLASSSDRAAVLRQWSVHPPSGFREASPSAWTALALLSSDHGEDGPFRFFIKGALERGVAPRDYWLSLVALRTGGRADSSTPGAETHPLGAALAAADAGDPATAIQALEKWQVSSEEDKTLSLLVGAQLRVAQGDVSRAIADLEAYEGPSSGVFLLLARLLLHRARHGHSTLPASDAARAMALAIRARDFRRLWEGPSAEAAHVAMQAALLANDHERAWKLVRIAPEGEATPSEGESPILRQEALAIAALRGDAAAGTPQILGASSDKHERSLFAVAEAAAAGNVPAQTAALLDAFERSPSDTHRLSVAHMLAHVGAALPDLRDLATEFPTAVAEITEVADFIREPDATLARLRVRSSDSRSLTALLAERLDAVGEASEAARVLERGSAGWTP